MIMLDDVLKYAAVILGNSGLVVFLQYLIERNSKTRKTLKALCYNTLSDKLNSILMRGYATETDRRDVQILFTAYHNEGWNGDMDDRMKRMYCLPFHPDEEMEVHNNDKETN